MAKLKDGFYKQTAEAIGSDLYVLLAGGGSKALNDFATSSGVITELGTNGNYLTWTKNSTVNNLTVPYATKAETIVGFSKRASANCNWGTLTSSNGYTPVYWGDTASGGSIAFSNKGTKTYFQIDGDYYANEGKSLVLHTDNYTTYTVKKDGTGASGTWGIDISGNAATATKIDKNSFSSTFNKLYYTSKSVTMTTTNTIWYVKISLHEYSQPNQLFVFCKYNNEIDRATIDFSGMSNGYIFKNNCQNDGNIKGICFKSSRDSTEKKWIFWLKFDPIYTDYYVPSSSATCTVYFSDQNYSFDVFATTTDPDVNWITTGSNNNNIVIKNATVYGTLSGNADTLDNYHANGLLTAASLGTNGNSTTLSVTVGGTTKTGSVIVPYANSSGYTTRLYANSDSNLVTNPGYYSLAYSRFNSSASNIFPVRNNANGCITAHLYNDNYYAQIGLSSDGRMYYRTMMAQALDSGVAWNKVAWTSDIPTVTDYYWANIKVSDSSNAYTTPQFGKVTIYDGTNSRLYLKTTTAGEYAYLAAYNTGGQYGADVVLHSGSALVLGAGESAAIMYYNNIDSLRGSENLYLTADGSVKIFTNCDSIGNRKQVVHFDTSGYTYFGSYINIGGHEKNASSPTYVWGSNSSDSFLRSYQTNSLRVGYADLAGDASKWATPRTITLTGSVTGSVSIDGSGDVTLVTTTNHTHNYLISHQSIYSLTVQGNGTTIGTYTPNSSSKIINITPSSIGAPTTTGVGATGTWNITANKANCLPITGYSTDSLSFNQTDKEFADNSGWCHYIIANHRDGASYYNYMIGLPFWSVPIYRRKSDNSTSGWHTFITSENISSQSVNYANYAGDSDMLNGYHASSFFKIMDKVENNSNANDLNQLGGFLNATGNGSGNSNYPEAYSDFFNLSIHYRTQFSCRTNFYWRTLYDSPNEAKWRTLIDSYNYSSYVGNGTVTVTQAGTTIGSFTMNQSGNKTINLSDTNTWRTIQCNGTSIGSNTLNLKAGNNITLSASGGTITINSSASSSSNNYYHTPSYSSGLSIATGTGVNALYVPYATDSQAGIVSTDEQIFYGYKTFASGIKIGSGSEDANTDNAKIYFGDGKYVWIGESPVDDSLTLNCDTTKNIYFSFGNSAKIHMTNSGSVYATGGFYESSDEILKLILNPVKVNLDDLSKLRKVYYLWKDNSDSGRQLGMIAQDVQKLYPELVSTDKNTGLLSLAYDRLSVIALEAIDTLYKDYTKLKERVDKLEKLLINKGIS